MLLAVSVTWRVSLVVAHVPRTSHIEVWARIRGQAGWSNLEHVPTGLFVQIWFKYNRKWTPGSARRSPQTLPSERFEATNDPSIAKMCMVVVFTSSDIRFWTD